MDKFFTGLDNVDWPGNEWVEQLNRDMMKLQTMLFNILVFVTLMGSFSGCATRSQNNNKDDLSTLPTETEVGAKVLPENIMPVKAPFSTLKFTKPKFPSDTLLLSLSGEELNTTKIQSAVDSLSKKGGGVIIIPKGEWLSGRIQLKDNINLHFEEGSILKFSGEIKDYLPVVFTRTEGVEVMSLGACIYANGATNIAITGQGRLVGPAKGSIHDKIFTSSAIENEIDPNKPISERIFDGTGNPGIFPPMFISPVNCKKVYIESISLENTAFWNIVPIYCDDVIIRGITVNSVGIPRGDGIDIDSSTNVLIEYCTLSCGDDCFTMKAGRGLDGIRVNKPTSNVVVRYCLSKKGHGGVTCGSETAGVIQNLYVHDCVFSDTNVGIRFKTRRPRGGGGRNLIYERLRLKNCNLAIQWDMLGSRKYVGELADRYHIRQKNTLTPFYESIRISDILVEDSPLFLNAVGLPESPINNVAIRNVEATCKKFIEAQDVVDFTFNNIKLIGKDLNIQMDSSKNIVFSNLYFDSSFE
jgi:polygalacturonase